jgi:prefoldin subunit 5
MADVPEALHPAEETAHDVSFELDEFRLVGTDRLELTGRWFGVRGRRFVRPMLTLLVGGESQRSLADLEHKPWAAVEGEPWTAAFGLEADPAELEAVELAVAPDVTLTLPLPTGARGRTRPKAPPKRATKSRGASDARRAEAEALRARLAVAERALEQERAAGGRIGESLAAERARNGQLVAAEKRIAELEAERHASKRELDRFHDELEQVHAEHEQLNSELDRLRADRRALGEQRDRVRIEFDRVCRERDDVRRERDELLGGFDQLRGERDQLRGEFDHLRDERDELASTEHAVRAPRQAGRAAAARAPRYEPPGRRRGGKTNWGGRALAVIVLLSVIAVLLMLVQHV